MSAKVYVFNGWAAKETAWKRCRFLRDRIFSYAEQLDGLADEVVSREKNVIFAGWSMGGATALRLAAAFPRKVKGLVLLAATPRMMAAPDWPGMSERRLAALRFSLDAGGTGGDICGEPFDSIYDAADAVNLQRGLDFLRETDLRIELIDLLASGALRCPVRIFQSEKDCVVHPNNAKFLSAVFPQSIVETVPGAEHALPLSIPDRIDEVMNGF
ncbi:MAG: alpha/beta fold hydrolase [Kiritimatiellae bacterium]|nr:alpha/beta fold hydrolase [Kiritimatiellia bacterium]